MEGKMRKDLKGNQYAKKEATKNKQVAFRCSDNEYLQLKMKADIDGLSVSEWARKKLLQE